jgi:hypothetical protein
MSLMVMSSSCPYQEYWILPAQSLPIGTAKFCPNCGKSLWVTTSETNESNSSSSAAADNDDVIQSKEITSSSQGSFKEIPNVVILDSKHLTILLARDQEQI